MTNLLDKAIEAVRELSADDQDEIARAMLALAGHDSGSISLTSEEREAIACSKEAAGRGEFASDEDMRAVWAKHGL
jgi:hypothetical protein